MVKQRCVNGELDDSNYSSPVPVIGLYIAGATWVCLLFIVIDIFSGFRNRKRWLPCRYFSLNSVTLTLLAIAAKIPVDLTTSMPSVEDQLSKLTATAFICTCMSFLVPSLAANSASDCFSNMTALSIFVITIIVNICIQIHTGVIILFRVQHIIIMCCMMLLLGGLWYTYFRLPPLKESFNDGMKDNLKNDTCQNPTMLYRLKLCYLFGYSANPQFTICKRWAEIPFAFLLDSVSSIVLGIAAFQSLLNSKSLDFCQGSNTTSTSDYRWSIRVVVISQIITVVVGCFGDIFRNLTMIGHRPEKSYMEDVADMISYNPILRTTSDSIAKVIANWVVSMFVSFTVLLLSVPCDCLVGFLVGLRFLTTKYDDANDGSSEYMSLIRKGDFAVDEWSLKKGLQDMKKWMEISKTKASSSMSNVVKLLTKTRPSEDQTLRNYGDSLKPGYKMSSLTIVVLEKIAAISLPSSLTNASLVSSSLKEAFKIIQFVDSKTSMASSFENRKISMLAEALFNSSNFNTYLLRKILKRHRDDKITLERETELGRAIAIIKGLEHVMHPDSVRDEVCIIANFLSDESRLYKTVDNLCAHIQQLFVDMLNKFLVQLPIAIYKEIVESPPEECEEYVKFALNLLCKVEQLERLVEWSFPDASSITNLIRDDNTVLPA